jgi:hypothetical protein
MDGKKSELPRSPLSGKRLSVVRLKGIPQKATLFDGTIVYRSKDDIIEIYQQGNNNHRVKCASYDNHFCYRVPNHILGWGMMCTCGGPAVLVGSNVYFGQSSPTKDKGLVPGELVVCYYHAIDGNHADGST